MTSHSGRRAGREIEIIDLTSDSDHEDQVPEQCMPRSPSQDDDRPPNSPSPNQIAYTEIPISDIYEFIAEEPNLTEPCKLILRLCVQVPVGSYKTYTAIKDHISSKYHMTSLRAVGLALEKNPWPPVTPCHRVVAFNGGIGVKGADWGEHGLDMEERFNLLRDEGVRFDKNGRLLGPRLLGSCEGEIIKI